MLQGYPASYQRFSSSQALLLRATGNAYPVTMVSQVVLPVLKQLVSAGFLKRESRMTVDELDELAKLSAVAVKSTTVSSQRHISNARDSSDD